MHNILKDFTGFLAYKLVNFMTANYPNYIESHPRFTVSNVEGELTELFGILSWFLLALLIFVVAKLIRNFNYYKDKAEQARMGIVEFWKNREKYQAYPGKVFTKKSAIVFAVLFVCILVTPVLTFIAGFKPMDFSDGMTLEDLSYQPGNQSITDEIVESMNENVIPGVVETGEMIEDVVSDPDLGMEMIKEVTGVDSGEIIEELNN